MRRMLFMRVIFIIGIIDLRRKEEKKNEEK